MSLKRTPLSKEQFEILRTTDKWKVSDVPIGDWHKIPDIQRLKDTVAILSSGNSVAGSMNGLMAEAGIDVVAIENNPKTDKGEGPLNVYHYAIQKFDDGTGMIYGPFRKDSAVEHWAPADAIDTYVKLIEKPSPDETGAS